MGSQGSGLTSPSVASPTMKGPQKPSHLLWPTRQVMPPDTAEQNPFPKTVETFHWRTPCPDYLKNIK